MVIQTFFVPGPLPGANEIIEARIQAAPGGTGKRRWNAYTVMKREVELQVHIALKQARIRPVTNDPLPWFSFRWIEPHRRRDPDNVAAARKFIFDALTSTRPRPILLGDGWAWISGGWTDSFAVGDTPGVKVSILANLAEADI